MFISYLVVLFPPLDILSAFPLNAITLGNSLLVHFVRDPHKQRRRRVVIPFRLLAAIFPLLGACIEHNLATILQYTGTVGIIIAFVYPALLQYYSVKASQRAFGPKGHLTQYTNPWWSSLVLAKAIAGLSVVGFVVVVVFTAIG